MGVLQLSDEFTQRYVARIHARVVTQRVERVGLTRITRDDSARVLRSLFLDVERSCNLRHTDSLGWRGTIGACSKNKHSGHGDVRGKQIATHDISMLKVEASARRPVCAPDRKIAALGTEKT
jgi:hypothetical protein